MDQGTAGPAHPRSRGENSIISPLVRSSPGSSPLTRGKRQRYADQRPASLAHPRSRGENLVSQTTPGTHGGSSPLTRGKRQRWNGPRGGIGLIPAHAGKTAPLRRVYCETEAHPRSRGENGQRSAAYFAAQGSSPLTRGKRAAQRRLFRSAGLIPAHAGKT